MTILPSSEETARTSTLGEPLDLESLLVCPLSKQPLLRDGDNYTAPTGFVYEGGDFRVPLDFSTIWGEGQADMEKYAEQWCHDLDTIPGRIEEVDEDYTEIYETLRMAGSVLDVAGWAGVVVSQARLDPTSYVCLDPIRIDFADIARRYPRFAKHYAAARNVARVQAHAEFLPLRDMTFDTVHMRSCLDHFASPRLALLEAYRVLRTDGSLILGISLEGAYHCRTYVGTKLASANPLYRKAVETLRQCPRAFQFAKKLKFWQREHDYHMWHPTYDGLQQLLGQTGFNIEEEVWMKTYHNTIFLRARRQPQYQPNASLEGDGHQQALREPAAHAHH